MRSIEYLRKQKLRSVLEEVLKAIKVIQSESSVLNCFFCTIPPFARLVNNRVTQAAPRTSSEPWAWYQRTIPYVGVRVKRA